MKVILLLIPSLLLAGCAALNTDAVVDESNRQTGAGITEFTLQTALAADGNPYISNVTLLDGKEKNRVNARVELPSGLKASYEADGIKAFPGQEIQGRVQELFNQAAVAQSADVREALNGLVPKVVEALKPLWAR